MRELEALIGGQTVAPTDGWTLAWLDRSRGIARISSRDRSETVLVEGSGSDWVVTLRGRRIRVKVRSWRERVLADAQQAAAGGAGPVEVRATLPGMVVAIAVAEGDLVGEGDPLVTVEAMKMQNEVRAPRAGTVTSVSVTVGVPVAAGAVIARIE